VSRTCIIFGRRLVTGYFLTTIFSRVRNSGLPDPQRDHALIMGRFARDCRIKFKEVTRKLELSLGPDTGDLCMRYERESVFQLTFLTRHDFPDLACTVVQSRRYVVFNNISSFAAAMVD
jgi:hypothetical protein